MMRSRAAGFTLIEMVLSLALMTICLSLLAPSFYSYLEDDAIEETKQEMLAIEAAMLQYYADTRVFPAEVRDIVENVPVVSGWNGPYMTIAFNDLSLRAKYPAGDPVYDAWLKDYVLVSAGTYARKVRSFGPNRVSNGGSGDDIEIRIDVTPLLRQETYTELDVINKALVDYNRDSLLEAPLSPPWTSALATLQSQGYLPAGSTYQQDSWGQNYVVAGPPVLYAITNGPP